MTENESIENLNEKYMDIEYYFAEHDCYMGEYDAEFQEAMATAMKERCGFNRKAQGRMAERK